MFGNTIKVRERRGARSKVWKVPPVEVDVFEVVYGSTIELIPVVIGLRLIVVNEGVSDVDDGDEVVPVAGPCVCVGHCARLIDGHALRRDYEQPLSSKSSKGLFELNDGVGHYSRASVIRFDVQIHPI